VTLGPAVHAFCDGGGGGGGDGDGRGPVSATDAGGGVGERCLPTRMANETHNNKQPA